MVGGFGKEKIRNKENPKYPILRKLEAKDGDINDIIQQIKKAGRVVQTGFSTSVKRLEFATDNWHTFKRNIENFREDVLPKFKFHYIKFIEDEESEIPDSVKEKRILQEFGQFS